MDMKLTKSQYDKMCKDASEPTKWYLTIPKAFLIGGLICTLGEVFLNMYANAGFSEKNAGIATSVTLILISAILTGFGLYDKIANQAGAGTLVPITGFANSVVAPAIEFKTEGYVTGLGSKIFIIAGPVILFGTLASVIYGLIYYLFL